VELLSGSETEEENIPTHLKSVIEMVSEIYKEHSGITDGVGVSPEYACLRSMMLEPQNPTMWNSIALVYLLTGRIEDAHDAIVRSLDLDSSIAWTWSIWGDLLSLRGDLLESERAYRMAVEMGSTDSHVLYQLFRLFSNRGNHSEALRILEQLLPQNPDDQSLWDLYTECVARNRRLLRSNP
jgi:tetratricopeptide (TPR) repeat protein